MRQVQGLLSLDVKNLYFNKLTVKLSLFKSITQKGNALLVLGRFDEAKEFYESLRFFNERQLADSLLKKLRDTMLGFYYFLGFYIIEPKSYNLILKPSNI